MLTFVIYNHAILNRILLITIQTHYQFKHIQKYITYTYVMKTGYVGYLCIAFVVVIVAWIYSIYTYVHT